jgi:hypothetical protein
MISLENYKKIFKNPIYWVVIFIIFPLLVSLKSTSATVGTYTSVDFYAVFKDDIYIDGFDVESDGDEFVSFNNKKYGSLEIKDVFLIYSQKYNYSLNGFYHIRVSSACLPSLMEEDLRDANQGRNFCGFSIEMPKYKVKSADFAYQVSPENDLKEFNLLKSEWEEKEQQHLQVAELERNKKVVVNTILLLVLILVIFLPWLFVILKKSITFLKWVFGFSIITKIILIIFLFYFISGRLYTNDYINYNLKFIYYVTLILYFVFFIFEMVYIIYRIKKHKLLSSID